MQELDRLRKEVTNLKQLVQVMEDRRDNLYEQLSELEDDTRHHKSFIHSNPPMHLKAVSILFK